MDFNGLQFDQHYIYKRMELLMAEELDEIEDRREDSALPGVQFGHLEGAGGRLVTKRGLHELRFIDMPGVFQLDMLPAIRREYNLTSYKLDSVAKHFDLGAKVELSPKEMMALWARGAPGDKARIGAYCVHDTVLPVRLAHRLDAVSTLMEMSNATYVPVDYILQRGQTVKCFSLLVRAMHARGMICPDQFITEGETEAEAADRVRAAEARDSPRAAGAGPASKKGYVGATVLEPLRGAYFQPVGVCDFASLVRPVARQARAGLQCTDRECAAVPLDHTRQHAVPVDARDRPAICALCRCGVHRCGHRRGRHAPLREG